jgi:methanethiol S-methyltransferase
MRTADDAVPPAAHAFAWGGALAFVASLSFFLYSYAVTFGENDGGSSRTPAVVTNVVLFTIFALHHTVFARQWVRARVARLVPAYLERAWYVWVASLLFVAVCLWWQPVGGVAWRLDSPWRWLALAGQAAGIWLTVHSAAVIDIFELSGIRQLSPRERPTEFKTSGPYGWVRHPIYSGWFLLVFAAPTMTMTRLVFAVVSSAYLVIAIPFEERSIRASSAGGYDAYARQVRWKLIPGVY